MRETTYEARIENAFCVKSGTNLPIRMFCDGQEITKPTQFMSAADGYSKATGSVQIEHVDGSGWGLHSFTVIRGGLTLKYHNSMSGEIQVFRVLSMRKNCEIINGIETHNTVLQFFVPMEQPYKNPLMRFLTKPVAGEDKYRRYDIYLHRHIEKYYYRVITTIKEFDGNTVLRKFKFNHAKMSHADEFELPTHAEVTVYAC